MGLTGEPDGLTNKGKTPQDSTCTCSCHDDGIAKGSPGLRTGACPFCDFDWDMYHEQERGKSGVPDSETS